ncbi:hypothetical protein FKM82_004970 [Ascaphus truei]
MKYTIYTARPSKAFVISGRKDAAPVTMLHRLKLRYKGVPAKRLLSVFIQHRKRLHKSYNGAYDEDERKESIGNVHCIFY